MIEFEMTQEQLDKLLERCKPVPYIIVGGMPPRSQQQNANDAWAALGNEMGFDPTTVHPCGKGDLFFTAIPVVKGEVK
jgi:hypothetical protein